MYFQTMCKHFRSETFLSLGHKRISRPPEYMRSLGLECESHFQLNCFHVRSDHHQGWE